LKQKTTTDFAAYFSDISSFALEPFFLQQNRNWSSKPKASYVSAASTLLTFRKRAALDFICLTIRKHLIIVKEEKHKCRTQILRLQ